MTPKEEKEMLKMLFEMKAKIDQASVLNGGFDEIEQKISEINKRISEISFDVKIQTEKFNRLEEISGGKSFFELSKAIEFVSQSRKYTFSIILAIIGIIIKFILDAVLKP